MSAQSSIEQSLKHSKIALFVILAFIALLTYLVITVSQQVQQQAMTNSSDAYESAYMRIQGRNGSMRIASNNDSQNSISNSIADSGSNGCVAKTTTSNQNGADSFGSCRYVCDDGTDKTVYANGSNYWTKQSCQKFGNEKCGCDPYGNPLVSSTPAPTIPAITVIPSIIPTIQPGACPSDSICSTFNHDQQGCEKLKVLRGSPFCAWNENTQTCDVAP